MRSGGRYKADKNGRLKRVLPPTKDHPQGNRARGEDEKDQPTRVVEQPAQRGGK